MPKLTESDQTDTESSHAMILPDKVWGVVVHNDTTAITTLKRLQTEGNKGAYN